MALIDEEITYTVNGEVMSPLEYINYLHEKLEEKWVNTKDRLPDSGMLIVKRWKNGSVWAGRYAGSAKDSSFDYWLQLEEKVDV